MATAREYWNGATQAVLTPDDVTAPKLRKESKFGHAVITCNKAFQMFYEARQLISRVSDGRVKNAMNEDLDGVGRTGWGMGINDLEEAFEHLAENGGKWTNDDKSVMGWLSSGKIGGNSRTSRIGYVPIPVSIENFLEALNGKAQKLNARLTVLRTHSKSVVNQVTASVGDQVLPRVGTPAWTSFGKGLKHASQAHEGIKGMLWLASVSEPSAMTSTSARLGGVLGAIGKVRGAVENFDKASRAGMRNAEGVVFTAICEGLGALPVLGTFYQEAFQLIPGIITGFTDITHRRNALAAKLGVDLSIIN